MVNGLAAAGLISLEDRRWLGEANDQANAAYPDPSTTRPGCYGPVLNPGARSWFKVEATALLSMTGTYLSILDRYGVAWVELPHAYPAEWPLPVSR